MSSKNKIAIISNLTSGGSVVYKKNLLDSLQYSNINEYRPRKFYSKFTGFIKILSYLKYIYFDLICDYYKISRILNKIKDIDKVIVFQDSYIKAPYVLFFLKQKTIYILHEPPREFYEPMSLHSVSKFNFIFNYFLRFPIKFMDYILTRMARIIVVNSQYSETVVQKIYKKSSIIIYPGINNSKKYFDGSKIKIGCISVGSLMDYKGHRKTIELISRIDISTRPPLVVIGGGKPNQITSLYNLAHKLNVNLKIKNNLSDKEVENEYKKAKIYINNAYFEPFGLAALESIIYGCILVTNNTGGTKEIKKYFPDKVKVCVDDYSMKNVLASALSEQSCSRVKIPSIFKWQRIAHKINNL